MALPIMEGIRVNICQGLTLKGIRCQKVVKSAQFCHLHKMQASSAPVGPAAPAAAPNPLTSAPPAPAPLLIVSNTDFDKDDVTQTGRNLRMELDLQAQADELRRQIDELSSCTSVMGTDVFVEPLRVHSREQQQQHRGISPLQESTLATYNQATYQPARADTVVSSKTEEWLEGTSQMTENLIKNLDRETAKTNSDLTKITTENTQLQATVDAVHRRNARLNAESKASRVTTVKLRDELRAAHSRHARVSEESQTLIKDPEATRTKNADLEKTVQELRLQQNQILGSNEVLQNGMKTVTINTSFKLTAPFRRSDAILHEVLNVQNVNLNLIYTTLYRRILESLTEDLGARLKVATRVPLHN